MLRWCPKLSSSAITQLAKGINDQIYTDNANIMNISKDFYTKLFTPSNTNGQKQDRLLRNITNKISKERKKELNKRITKKGVRLAVFDMKENKSLGFDGIPIE